MLRDRRFLLRFLSAAAIAAAAAGQGAAAGPYDGKSCQELGAGRDALKNLGVELQMEKGHEWARGNLAPDELSLIKQFIEIAERIKFRCNGSVAAPKPQAVAAAPSDEPVNLGADLPPPPLPVKRGAAPLDAVAPAAAKPAAKPPAAAKAGAPREAATPVRQRERAKPRPAKADSES